MSRSSYIVIPSDELLMAIKEEITRLNRHVNSFERSIWNMRQRLAAGTVEPVGGQLDLEQQLEYQQEWKDALVRRVLQLAGVDGGIGITTTWQGSRDPRLVNA